MNNATKNEVHILIYIVADRFDAVVH